MAEEEKVDGYESVQDAYEKAAAAENIEEAKSALAYIRDSYIATSTELDKLTTDYSALQDRLGDLQTRLSTALLAVPIPETKKEEEEAEPEVDPDITIEDLLEE